MQSTRLKLQTRERPFKSGKPRALRSYILQHSIQTSRPRPHLPSIRPQITTTQTHAYPQTLQTQNTKSTNTSSPPPSSFANHQGTTLRSPSRFLIGKRPVTSFRSGYVLARACARACANSTPRHTNCAVSSAAGTVDYIDRQMRCFWNERSPSRTICH